MRGRIWVPKTTILSEKGLFQWVGMEDMVSKILKKNTDPCEKKPPLFHTLRGHGSRLMPYSFCAVRLCVLRHLRMQIRDHDLHLKAKELETQLQATKANEEWARSIVAHSVAGTAPPPQGSGIQGSGSQGSQSASPARGVPPKPQ